MIFRAPFTLPRWRQHSLMAVGIVTLPLMLVFAATVGDMPVSYTNAGKAILNGLGLGSYVLPQVEEGIVWQYRMSRALMAACSGGGLALCGLVMQAILRNPLAEPYLLGISSGASLGGRLCDVAGDWRQHAGHQRWCLYRRLLRVRAYHAYHPRRDRQPATDIAGGHRRDAAL